MSTAQSNTGTTNSTPGSCVTCQVKTSRRVRYLFKTGLWASASASERALRIPVAVAVDGRIKPEFRQRTGTLTAYHAFDVWVQPGQRVSLYLNSDAVPDRRTAAVFEITPQDRHVLVVVNERRGLLGEHDQPQKVGTKTDEHGQSYDEYEALLSGDTWKKVTHRFTAQEAQALIPADTPTAVRDQVLSLYDGRCHGPLNVTTEQGHVRVEFENASNPQENVTGFDLFSDGLPRVHPNAWLAVIDAAVAAGVSVVRTSSAWRPMLGAIVHRSGLGLDVNYLDNTRLNRQGLTPRDVQHHVARSPSVSPQEPGLFAQKEQADAQARAAEAQVKVLQNKFDKLAADDPRRTEVSAALADAAHRLDQASLADKKANDAWNDDRDSHEPGAVKSFRRYLLHCDCVSQVFDPWFMDVNTHDGQNPTPNTQVSGNEKLHATHLHVTVKNPGMNV